MDGTPRRFLALLGVSQPYGVQDTADHSSQRTTSCRNPASAGLGARLTVRDMPGLGVAWFALAWKFDALLLTEACCFFFISSVHSPQMS